MKNLIALLAFLLLFPLSVSAQATADVSLTLVPTNPKPGETVRLTLQSYAADLSKSMIIWRYGDRVVGSGIGKTALSVIAPGSGQVAAVSATATIPNADAVTVTTVLRPASIDVLWEATDSYVPPFYKGKALPSTNATVRITAIPGANAPKNVSYIWKQGDTVLQNASGYNRSSFSFQNSELTDTESVSVTGSGGIWNGIGSVSIPIISPSLIGYPVNGRFIDYANGSTNWLSTGSNGIEVVFEPFYFSLASPNSQNLLMNIDASGEIVDISGSRMIAFSQPENGNESMFSVRVETALTTLQQLTRAFTISFFQ